MKVLLAAIDARFTHTNLALRYLRAAARAAGHEAHIADWTINHHNRQLLEGISKYAPDVIVFSVYIWNSLLIASLISDIRAIFPRVIIVCGGPEATTAPERWRRIADYTITGAGEAAFAELAESGFHHPESLLARANPPFAQIPFPWLAEDVPVLANRYVYYESSRGCAFSCAYCLSAAEKAGVDERPLPMVDDELNYLCGNGFGTVKFVDRSFNHDPARALRIWEMILAKGGETVFQFELHPLLLTEELFAFIATVPAGRFRFEVGLQSLSPEVLTACHRSPDSRRALEHIRRLCAMRNVVVHADLIAGLPFETRESFGRAISALTLADPAELQLGFLKLLSGTPLAARAAEYGIIASSDPPHEVYQTKWMQFSDLSHFHEIEDMIEGYHNSGNFSRSLRLGYSTQEPYPLFIALAKRLQQLGYPTGTRRWALLGQVLFDELIILCPDTVLVTDCLRWDWIHANPGIPYPDFLATGYDQLRERCLGMIRAERPNQELTARTVFFAAQSSAFRAEGYSPSVFIGAGKKGIQAFRHSDTPESRQ